jgi:hypothetical protein
MAFDLTSAQPATGDAPAGGSTPPAHSGKFDLASAKPVAAPSAHPVADTAGFIGGNLGKGVAQVAGMPVDLANDAIEGVKGIANKFGAHLKQGPDPVGGSTWFEDEFKQHGMMPSDAVTTPTSRGGKIAAGVLQALPSGALPGGEAGPTARYLGAAASGAGGEIGRQVGGTPGQLVGSMLGGAAGGMAGRENPRIAAGVDAKSVPTEAQRAADRAGIPVTQGQASGNPTTLRVESALHNLFGSKGTAQESVVKQAAAGMDSVNRLADQISAPPKGIGTGVEAARTDIGERLRDAYSNTVENLVKARSADATKNYSAVRALAGDQPVVKYDNTMKELDSIIAEHDGVPSDDARTITRKAQQMKDDLTTQTPGAAATPATPPSSILDAQGRPVRAGVPATVAGLAQQGVAAHSITNAMRTRSNWGAAARRSGNIFQDIDPNANQILAKRLYGAINRDFDAAANGNATWAPALRAANLRYARQSQSLEYIQQSTLGKMLGKNVVDADLTGLQATTKPPEAIARKLLNMDPSQVRTTAAILQRGSPEVLQGAKAFILRDALHRSVDQIGDTPQLNFTKFQKNIAQLAPQINGLGFSTAERNQIKDIIDTMATVGKQAKPKAGISKATLAEGAVALAGHGLAAAATAGISAIGTWGLSKAFMTQSGRQLLRQVLRAKDVRTQMATLGALRSQYGQTQAGQPDRPAPRQQFSAQPAPARSAPPVSPDQTALRELAGLGVSANQANLLMKTASEPGGMARVKAMGAPRKVIEALYKHRAAVVRGAAAQGSAAAQR